MEFNAGVTLADWSSAKLIDVNGTGKGTKFELMKWLFLKNRLHI